MKRIILFILVVLIFMSCNMDTTQYGDLTILFEASTEAITLLPGHTRSCVVTFNNIDYDLSYVKFELEDVPFGTYSFIARMYNTDGTLAGASDILTIAVDDYSNTEHVYIWQIGDGGGI